MTDQFNIDIALPPTPPDARMVFLALCPRLDVDGEHYEDATTARRLHGVFSEHGTFLGLSIMLGNAPDEELWYLPIYRAPDNAISMALGGDEDTRKTIGLPTAIQPNGTAIVRK